MEFSEMSYKDFASIFHALADETRMKIMGMLSAKELNASEILEHFDIKQPTLSYHMKILCSSGVVNCKKDGNWVLYSINKDRMERVKRMLVEYQFGKAN